MQFPFIGHASACSLVRLRSFLVDSQAGAARSRTLPELLCDFKSAVCSGLQAAKLLPRHSLGSLSGKLPQVCSVTKNGVRVACQGTYQLSTAFLVDLFQLSLLHSSLFAALL